MARDLRSCNGVADQRPATSLEFEVEKKNDQLPSLLEEGTLEQKAANQSDMDADSSELTARMSQAFRWRGYLFVALCAYGFAPSVLVFFKARLWFLQAVLRRGGAFPFTKLLTVHVASAFSWLLLALLQLWSGSTKGETRRSLHRCLGTWSPVIIVPFVGSSLVAQYGWTISQLRDTISSPASLVPGFIAATSLIAFSLAYYAAKWKRDFKLHKDCIIFAIATSVTPGTTRAVWYAMQPFLPATCDVTINASLAQGGTAIAFGIELIVLTTAWHSLGRARQRHCTAFLLFLVFMTLFCAVDGLRLAPSSSC